MGNYFFKDLRHLPYECPGPNKKEKSNPNPPSSEKMTMKNVMFWFVGRIVACRGAAAFVTTNMASQPESAIIGMSRDVYSESNFPRNENWGFRQNGRGGQRVFDDPAENQKDSAERRNGVYDYRVRGGLRPILSMIAAECRVGWDFVAKIERELVENDRVLTPKEVYLARDNPIGPGSMSMSGEILMIIMMAQIQLLACGNISSNIVKILVEIPMVILSDRSPLGATLDDAT